MQRILTLLRRRPRWQQVIVVVVISIAYLWLRRTALSGAGIAVFSDSGSYTDSHSSRPITTPLFFHLLNNNFVWIWRIQFLTSAVSWLLVAGAIRITVPRSVNLLAPVVVLALSLTKHLVQWDVAMLSESISFSLFNLVLAASLCLYKRFITEGAFGWRLYLLTACLWSPLLFLFSNTRDSNIYLIPLFVLAAAWVIPAQKGKWPYVTVLLVIVGAIAGFQNANANRYFRWEFSLENVVLQRVLVDPEARQFFRDRGMPYNDSIQQLAGHWASDPELLAQADLMKWVHSTGKSTYQSYLLSHPVATNHALIKALPAAFAPVDYATTPGRLPRLIDLLFFFPIRTTWFWLLLIAVWPLALLFGYRHRRTLCCTALLMLAAFYTQAFIAFHGDAMEIGRHALFANVLFRGTLLVNLVGMILLILDRIEDWSVRFNVAIHVERKDGRRVLSWSCPNPSKLASKALAEE